MTIRSALVGICSAIAAAHRKGTSGMTTVLLLAVLAAAAIASWRYANIKATDDSSWLILLLIGFSAIGFELCGAEHMVESWWDRRPFALVVGALLWGLGFAFSLHNAVGSAAQYQETLATTQKAAHHQHVDSRAALGEARRNLDRIDKRIAALEAMSVNGKPIRTPDAAQSDIDKAKAHRFWASTKECTETKGPQTRAFCDGYRGARAEKDMAGELIRLRDDRIAAASDVSAREKQVAGVKVTASDERADLSIVKTVFGMSSSGASMAQTMHQALTICLFVTLAGFWRAYQARKDTPRVKWFNFAGWIGRARQAWDGKEPISAQRVSSGSMVPLIKPV